jgi:hypothetical protein
MGSVRPGGRRSGRPASVIPEQSLNSALAENYFKPKMISGLTLPGVFDIDLEPFIDESEG